MRARVQSYIIPAGQVLQLNIPGKYFSIKTTSSPISIEFLKRNQVIGDVKGVSEGDSFGPFEDGFHGIKITSDNGLSQTIKIGIASDEVSFSTLTGSVSISGGALESVYNRDSINKNHFAATHSIAPVAATRSVIQLWNPAASGKLLVLRKISVMGDNVSNLITVISASVTEMPSIGPVGVNKFLFQGNAVGLVKFDNRVSIPGVGFANHSIFAYGNIDVFHSDDPALIIAEGNGVQVHVIQVDITLTVNFEWEEIPVP